MDNTINRKDYDEKAFKKLLVNFLKTKPQGATQLEMVVGTGLSKDWVELAVRALLDDYPAHLETNEKHELIYVFDFDAKEESLTFLQVANKVLRGIWKGFIVFFKVWTLLMYCTYFLVNAIILILFFIVISIFALFAGYEGGFGSGGFIERVMGQGERIVQDAFALLNRRPSEEQEDDEGAVHQMFSYIFGETIPKPDDLAIEKLLLNFIVQNKGKIVAAEIVQLTGWSIRKAQEETAQLMASYHGDAEVTDEGVIVYSFPDLEDSQEINKLVETYNQKLRAKKLTEIKKREHKKLLEEHTQLLATKAENESGENIQEKIPAPQLPTKAELRETHAEEIEEAVKLGTAPIWERLLPARRMNDNDKEINRSIVSGNQFNWMMSFLSPIMLVVTFMLIVGAFKDDSDISLSFFLNKTYLIILFVIPFCYSFLFWLIPNLRRFRVNAVNRRIDAINEKYRLLGVIFDQIPGKLYKHEVLDGLQQKIVPEGKKLRNKELPQLLDQKAHELEAESMADTQGAYYIFEEVQTDLEVIKTIRNG
ncbi:hypothetical protein [uncultured Microscilla sp.]|uniref:hypothetical protein n=1 Tax=uncultured Microscilla sp. TaxID=432653 RepID=UPI0026377BB0|nr:hypothetical protein [uncultured Microscilla sp.]